MRILVAIGDVIGMAVQNAKLHAQVREHAARDPLTGLYNRRRFEEVHAGGSACPLSIRRP